MSSPRHREKRSRHDGSADPERPAKHDSDEEPSSSDSDSRDDDRHRKDGSVDESEQLKASKKRKHSEKKKKDKKKKKKEKDKDRDKSSKKLTEDEKRLLKEAKRILKQQEKTAATASAADHAAVDPSTISKISAEDYFEKSAEFATWLQEERGQYFNELTTEQTHELFNAFVEHWNAAHLAAKYYAGGMTAPMKRTAHKWKFKKGS